MTDFDSIWHHVEQAAADDPAPLLIAADWLEENNHSKGLAYALKWCAGHHKRPWKRTDLKWSRWEWYRDGRSQGPLYMSSKERKLRSTAFLSRLMWNQVGVRDSQLVGALSTHKTSHLAYRSVAVALAAMRAVVEVPNIVAPPQPSISLPPSRIECQACGVERKSTIAACPVCNLFQPESRT